MREAPIGLPPETGWIVTGVFERPDEAAAALRALRAAGFASGDVGGAFPGADANAAASAWLADQRTFDLGNLGVVSLAGTTASAVAGARQAGPGGLAEVFASLGIDLEHAAWYAEKACQGFAVVVVRAGTREVEARRIMHDRGSRETPPTEREPSTLAGYALSVRDAVTQPPGYDRVAPRPGWAVFGSDEQVIGSVDAVGPTYLLIRAGRGLARDLFVPFSAVAKLGPGCVYLGVPATAAGSQGWHEEPGTGPADHLTDATYRPAGFPAGAPEVPEKDRTQPPGNSRSSV